eukprot:Sspe_Gene.33517::Locus_16360_Transcript_1_1_Confidence_1.000_Length_4102::g.33517::m.33517
MALGRQTHPLSFSQLGLQFSSEHLLAPHEVDSQAASQSSGLVILASTPSSGKMNGAQYSPPVTLPSAWAIAGAWMHSDSRMNPHMASFPVQCLALRPASVTAFLHVGFPQNFATVTGVMISVPSVPRNPGQLLTILALASRHWLFFGTVETSAVADRFLYSAHELFTFPRTVAIRSQPPTAADTFTGSKVSFGHVLQVDTRVAHRFDGCVLFRGAHLQERPVDHGLDPIALCPRNFSHCIHNVLLRLREAVRVGVGIPPRALLHLRVHGRAPVQGIIEFQQQLCSDIRILLHGTQGVQHTQHPLADFPLLCTPRGGLGRPKVLQVVSRVLR